MLYLTGAATPSARDLIAAGRIGVMNSPAIGYPLHRIAVWAADNGCYSQGDRFDLSAYLRWLERHQPHRDRCLFATAPDVVGDATATLTRSLPVLPLIRELGYPAAYVAQDGATPDTVPWQRIDALFIGGTTAWKLSPAAAELARTAHTCGAWVHMGRVNGASRWRYADSIGCHSVDGTFLAYRPDRGLPEVLAWSTQPAQGVLL